MKTASKLSLLTLGLAVLVCAVPARAQNAAMKFDVPFQFVAGDQVLPAGQYRVVVDQFPRILVRPAPGGTYALPLSLQYLSRPTADLGTGKLQFTRYGDTFFLTAVWGSNQLDARAVAPSKRQADAANAAAKAGEPAAVTLESAHE